jgi:hypothetical protein
MRPMPNQNFIQSQASQPSQLSTLPINQYKKYYILDGNHSIFLKKSNNFNNCALTV